MQSHQQISEKNLNSVRRKSSKLFLVYGKAAFCHLHEKAVRKYADEIGTWWQELQLILPVLITMEKNVLPMGNGSA